jgi:hypothetical protein
MRSMLMARVVFLLRHVSIALFRTCNFLGVVIISYSALG